MPRSIRVAVILGCLTIAQFMAYQQLLYNKNRKIDEANSSLSTKEAQLRELENKLRDRDQRLAQLEEKFARVASAVSPAPEAPILEGIRFTQKQIPSPHGAAPFGVYVTIQTDVPIQPTRLLVECDGVIYEGDFRVEGAGMLMMVRSRVLHNQPNVFELGFSQPPFLPETPITLTLFSDRPIRIKGIQRLHDFR